MLKKCFLITLFILMTLNICFSATVVVVARLPAFAEDPTPLKPPKPLVRIEASNDSTLWKAILNILKKFEFKLTNLDSKENVIEATRYHKSVGDLLPSRDYDSVIIWLERDFDEPNKYIKIYLAYGLYSNVLADISGARRFKTSPLWEEKNIGKLKEALVSISVREE